MLLVLLAAVAPALGQLEVGGNVTVEVEGLGRLRGSVAQTARGQRPFAQFLGVRFAEKPDRFQAPEAVGPWIGTLDALEHAPACVQFSSTGSGAASRRHPAADVDPTLLAMAGTPRQAAEDEDCLFLDVYTPNVTGRLPVLVYMHGGAFVGGSSRQVRPHFLLDHDLVLVAPQYRLGPLGFLSLQTAEVPGNAGLRDQLLALRWVRDHVASFGGDPRQVTLAGGSAGAASAALLQLSPLSQQPAALFQRVYLESGSALAPWSFEDDPVSRASVVAVGAGCLAALQQMADCLRNATAAALKTGFLTSAMEDMLSGGTGLGGALPVVDASASAGTSVLPQRPLEAIRADSYRALPMLVGVTKHEGTLPLALLKIYKKILDSTYNGTDFYKTKTINDLVRRVMMIEENRVATDAVAEKYFKTGTLTSVEAMTPSLVDLAGAVHFKGPALSTVEYNSKTGNDTYLYAFNHQDQYNFDAVTHCADLVYLFPQPNVNLTAEEESVSQKLVQLVANFVIHGNTTATSVPGVSAWPPYTVDDPAFLLVDRAPQLRRDFRRQLTVAATEGLKKHSSAAAAGGAGVATLLAAAAAALALH